MVSRAGSLVVLVSTLLATQPGCEQYLRARARRASDARDAARSRAFDQFLAEYEAAFDAHDYAAAAAAFTPEREHEIGRYGTWSMKKYELWAAILDAAAQLETDREYTAAATLVELAPPLARNDDEARRIEHTAGRIRERAAELAAAWHDVVGKVDADTQAGRFATAAARLASPPTAPDAAQADEAQRKLCGLVERAAAPHRQRIFVTAGTGDAGLVAKMLASVRAGRYGSAVELVDRAADADVVITVGLAAERLEETTTTTSRTGRYVAGSKLQPNPKIASLRRDIDQLTKDAASKERSIARIRCSGDCRSRVAEQDQLARIRERLRSKQQDLGRQPAQVNAPVEAELSYPVKVHTWTLHQLVLVDARTAGGKPTPWRPDMTRVATSEAHDAVPQLSVAAARPTRPDVAAMRTALQAQIVHDSPYVIHNNLAARNQVLGQRVQAATGAERGELISTFVILNPTAQPEVAFANDELLKLLGLSGAGSKLATQTQACWAQAPLP